MESFQKIGVGITTRNRRAMFNIAHYKWWKFLLPYSKIVIVDDASTKPNEFATYRFTEQAGIAKAKNKCLELLDDCEHIFLCDDDIFPITPDWWKPYVKSPFKHLQLSFEKDSRGRRLSHSVYMQGTYQKHTVFNAPNGCMYYIHRDCINKVGGFRPQFGVWGCEHVEYSRRIFNNKLTPFPFIDVENSLKLFHVADYFGEIVSSVPSDVRLQHIHTNLRLLDQYKDSTDFVPYKITPDDLSKSI